MDKSTVPERYTKLRTYEILWKDYYLGFDLGDMQRMVYNPCINAKQKIVFCDGRNFMVIKVTEEVMEIIKRVIDKRHILWIREAQ